MNVKLWKQIEEQQCFCWQCDSYLEGDLPHLCVLAYIAIISSAIWCKFNFDVGLHSCPIVPVQFLATKTIPISRMAPELSLKFQCSSQECMEPWLGMQFLCAVLDSHKTFALSAAWLVVNKSKGFILKQIFLSRVSVCQIIFWLHVLWQHSQTFRKKLWSQNLVKIFIITQYSSCFIGGKPTQGNKKLCFHKIFIISQCSSFIGGNLRK